MNATAHRRRRPGSDLAGFVLIYTLWIIAAASLALALLAKSASQPARVGERQFSAAIELPEALNVLDYVLAHAVSQKREIDPRFITFRQEIARESAREGRDLVRELKQILSQIGMELDIPDADEPGLEVVTEGKDKTERADDEPVTVVQGRLFAASTEDKTVRLGDASYQVRVHPGNARPNLNAMAREPLARYLAYLGLADAAAERLAAVIHDWVDPDDFLSDDGAESAQYPFQQGPRNAPIRSWDEVFYLKGANAELVEFLRTHFTLHGGTAPLNAEFLEPEALAVITDLEPWQITVALENHALPKDERVELSELIGEEEATRFASLVGWDVDVGTLLVQVRGTHTEVSAVLDTSSQQLLDWYLLR